MRSRGRQCDGVASRERQAVAVAAAIRSPDNECSSGGSVAIQNSHTSTTHTQAPTTTPAVRPTQGGEWLRKVITRRILDADKLAATKKLLQSRQWGIGVTGGAESIAITHLIIEYLWASNLLSRPLAVIQVDQKDCFGQFEYIRIDEAIT